MSNRHHLIQPRAWMTDQAWTEIEPMLDAMPADGGCVVLVIDANQYRAVQPVRRPGAMLCAMTRIAERGGLNLHGSLIRLKQWKIYNK